MGSPQDPSAPPAPQAPPDGKDWQSLGAAIETPGLAVPVAPVGPPTPNYWSQLGATNAPQTAPAPAAPPAQQGPEVGVPGALAPAQGGKLAESVRITAPGETTGYGQPALMRTPSAGSVGDLRRQAETERGETETAQKGIRNAEKLEKTAIDAQANVDRAKADANAIAYTENATRMARIQADEDAGNTAYTAKRTQLDDAYNKAVADQDKFVFDPDQYVKNMSFGSKLFTVIAIGLSGMGNSRSIGGSGENLALKGLNDSIQANVDAQKQAYQRLGQKVDRATNAYAKAREMHLDDHAATLAARQASIAQLNTAVDTITARYAGEEVDARRQQLKAHLETEGAKTQAEFTQRSHADAQQARASELQLRQANYTMQLGTANYNLAAQGEADRHNDRLAEMAMKTQIAEQKAAGKGPGGIADWTGQGATLEQQNKAAGVKGAYDSIAPLMQKALDFRKEHRFGTASRDAVGQAEALHEATLLEVKNLAQLGVLSDSDIQLVNKLIGPSADSYGSDDKYNARMGEAMDYIKKKAYAQMRSYGYMPTSQSDPLSRKADPMTANTGFVEAGGGR